MNQQGGGGMIRVGVIGCGEQGSAHLRAYRQIADVDVVAICDTDPARLDQAGQAFGVAGRYPTYGELLAGEQIELISVCTMPATHREITVAALQEGANVLCEKPMALNAAEAATMIDAA